MTANYSKKTIKRFWSKVDRRGSDECWEWQAGRDKDGYGRFALRGGETKAHRFSYEIHYEDIPEGRFVCHSCDNPPCVNPEHIWLGTAQENAADAVEKDRMFRPKGEMHPMSILTRDDVKQIITLHQKGRRHNAIAKRFGISRSLVSGIIRGDIWSHVDRPHDLRPASKAHRGNDHPTAKLTEADVRKIRKLYATGQYRQVDLAAQYAVTQRTISLIVRRETWAHVEDGEGDDV